MKSPDSPTPTGVIQTHRPQASAPAMQVVAWVRARRLREKKGDSLKGFLSLQLASGLILHECTFRQRQDGTRWIDLPSRFYRQNGATKRQRLVDFIDQAKYAKFQREAKAALDAWFAMHPEQNGEPAEPDTDADIPL